MQTFVGLFNFLFTVHLLVRVISVNVYRNNISMDNFVGFTAINYSAQWAGCIVTFIFSALIIHQLQWWIWPAVSPRNEGSLSELNINMKIVPQNLIIWYDRSHTNNYTLAFLTATMYDKPTNIHFWKYISVLIDDFHVAVVVNKNTATSRYFHYSNYWLLWFTLCWLSCV